MLTQHLDAVIGVDTHKHTHTAAAVASTGAVLEHITVAADPRGYRQVLAFGRRHGAALWAIEGAPFVGHPEPAIGSAAVRDCPLGC